MQELNHKILLLLIGFRSWRQEVVQTQEEKKAGGIRLFLLCADAVQVLHQQIILEEHCGQRSVKRGQNNTILTL